MGGPDDHTRPLSLRGREQARQLAPGLLAARPSRLFSSPYLRARQTIEPAASLLGLPVEEREDLREWDSGLAVQDNWQAHYRHSWEHAALRHPGGESHVELQRRAVHALRVITAGPRDALTVVASHGTWIARALHGLGVSVDADFWLSMPMPAVFDLVLEDGALRALRGPGLGRDLVPVATEPLTAMTPERATPSDAGGLARLREDAARWQQERGIVQWTPGDVRQVQLAEQAAAGEWYVLRAPGLLGAIRLLDADPLFWGDQEDLPALYVHGLVTSRTAPKGTGAALLRWAEERAEDAGCHLVRLDCVQSNTKLRRYYEDQGYRRVGRTSFASTSVALYEKALARKQVRHDP